MAKIYFVRLDVLRFIGAVTVAISHFETLKQYRNLPYLHNRFFEHAAQIAVTFFFVLSGFLIMWWFLEETKGDIAKISLKSFYINRITRIWPLYFLVVFLSIIISLLNGTFETDQITVSRYLAYVLFLPNTADLFFQRDIYLGPTWSLAVEEFFYLFFPLLLISIHKDKLLKVLLLLAALFMLLSTVINRIFLTISIYHFQPDFISDILTTFFERYRIYSFLLGAAAAVLIYNNIVPESTARNKYLYYPLGVIIALFYFNGITFSFLTHQIYSMLFAIFIFFIAVNNKQSNSTNKGLFNWGGKISFSIYMLHMFILLLIIDQGFSILPIDNKIVSIFTSWLIYLAGVFLIAHLSYAFFESPIRAKARNWFASKMEKNVT